MKVLVTGGSGRAGKYVIKDLLENGHSVVNADMINGYLEDRNPELSFKKIDFTDYGQTVFATENCDAIIHLAAIPNPGVIPNQEVFRVNMLSTFNILEVAEYESDGAGLVLSKGSTVYDSTKTDGLPNPAPTSGLDVSPNL